MKKKNLPLIFVILYLAYTSIYIARLNLSMASHDLTVGTGLLTTEQYGILSGAFLVIYALGRLINGGLSDRIRPWIMLCTGLGGAGLANLLFSLFPPFIGMLILWCANAWAQSMLWSSVLCVVAASWEESKAKKITSYVVTSVTVGNLIAIPLSSLIITSLGLAYAFLLPGGLTLVMGAAVFFTLRHIGLPTAKADSAAADTPQSAPVSELLKKPDIRLTVPSAFLHGIMKDNITGWMTKFFIFTFAIDLTEASLFVFFIPLVGFVGRMIYPLIYRLCGEKEHTVSLLGFAICTVSSLPLIFGFGGPILAMICLSLMYAAVSLINTTLLSIYPIEYAKSGRVATVSGIMDFATYLGAGLGSMVYGTVIENFGYAPMFASWAAVSVLSIFLTGRLIRVLKKM